MTAPQALDFAAKLKVTADVIIIQNSKTVNDSKRLADHFNNLIGIEVQIFVVAHGKNQGICTADRLG